MKLRFPNDYPHKGRDERILDLGSRMIKKFPDHFSDFSSEQEKLCLLPRLFTFCDIICQIDVKQTAPIISLCDLPIIFWGCNDMGWSKRIVDELDQSGSIMGFAYNNAKNYSIKYFPQADEYFFSSLELLYSFYKCIFTIDQEQLQFEFRNAILNNATSRFDYSRISNYEVNFAIIDNSRIYSFHGEASTILKGNLNKSDEVLKNGPMYMDAPIGIILSYKNVPNAVLTFFPESPSFLLVHQIQGLSKKYQDMKITKKRPKGLFDIEWRKAMLDFASYLASKANMGIGIISAKNNPWTKPDSTGKYHLDFFHAKKIYDGLAVSNGLTIGDDGNFYQK